MRKRQSLTAAVLTLALTLSVLSGYGGKQTEKPTGQETPENVTAPGETEETPGKEEKPEMTEEELEYYMRGQETAVTHTVKYNEDNIYRVIDASDPKTYSNMGLPLDKTTVRGDSDRSVKWEKQDKRNNARLNGFPADVTPYDSICLWIYSEKNTGSKMQLCFNCQPSETTPGKNSYRRAEITVNWTGWKLITLKIREFADAYDADLTQVKSIVLNATGWNMTPDSETVLYFDEIFFANCTDEFSLSPEEIGDYNYDKIIKTLAGFLNGGVSVEDASPAQQRDLLAVAEKAENLRLSMNGNGLPFDFDMETTDGISKNYYSIRDMAKGYAVKGGSCYKDSGMLADIVYALDYMHENYYKDKTLHSYPKLNNWWDWQIGAAQAIVNTIMLIRDEITQEQIDKWLTPVNLYDPLPTMTMANRVDIAYVTLAAAALQKDMKRLVLSRDALDECCYYVEQGDGFYTDGSFIQHTVIPYTGSYGPIMLEALSKLITAVKDTCFTFTDSFINCQYDWAKDCFTPLMYHGAFFGLVRGRSVYRSSTDVSTGLAAVQGMLRMTEYLSDAEKIKEIKSVIKEYDLYNADFYTGSLSAYDISLLEDIRADSTVAARDGYAFAKVFARMDRAIAQLPGYGIGIALSSSRIAKYEAINGENGEGWYTGDGMLYVYNGVNDYDAQYWKNVNHYRIPGTTVTTAPRTAENINAYNTLSQYDFSGGASLGLSLAAAMDFESATAAMNFESTLNGKKMWFVSGSGILCMGCGITCSDAFDTETVIENRRLPSGSLYLGEEAFTEGAGTATGIQELYIDGFGGAYLPEKTDISYNITSGGTKFAEVYINHGQNPENAAYAYILLPGMTREETDAYAKAPSFEILSNTPSIQAARDTGNGVTAYIFREAGSFDGYTVSAPCVLLVSEKEIAASDPTQKLTALTVTDNDGKAYEFTLEKGATTVLNK